MGLFDRMERKLERAVNGAFAKAFRSEVQPVEIASAMRRAMDDRAAANSTTRASSRKSHGRVIVPNVFTIELSGTDFDRLSHPDVDLEGELIAAAEEHAQSQHYQPGGPIDIILDEDTDLETGVFRLRPTTAKRPHATGHTGQHHSLHRAAPRAPHELDADRAPHQPYDDQPYDEQPYGHEPYDEEEVYSPAPRRASAPSASSARPAPAAPPTPAAAPAAHTPGPAAPPPAPPRVSPADRPWLDIDGERYPLMGAITILGRDDSADIILDDPGISRRHSEIRVTQDGPHMIASIRDLGSTNGTFVNGERITSTHLGGGDRITVGRTSVTYRAGRK